MFSLSIKRGLGRFAAAVYGFGHRDYQGHWQHSPIRSISANLGTASMVSTRRMVSNHANSGRQLEGDTDSMMVKSEVNSGGASPKRKRAKPSKVTTRETKKVKEENFRFRPPANWRETLDLIVALRAERNAPVDTMGAERLSDPNVSQKEKNFHTLVSLMLSSQTKDQVVSETMNTLVAEGLTVESVMSMDAADLNERIKKVGFHPTKTKYIKRTAEIIMEKHRGEVPSSFDELTEFPGVGPKMAYLVLNIMGNPEAGIGVDTHMHRICNQLGWVKSKNPEETRKQLQSWLPKSEWKDINLRLVGLGQMIQQPAYRAKLLQYVDTKPDDERNKMRKLLLRLGLKRAHFE